MDWIFVCKLSLALLIHMLNTTPQGGGFRKWGLWKEIRSWISAFPFQKGREGRAHAQDMTGRQAFPGKRSSWNAHPCWHLPLGSYY